MTRYNFDKPRSLKSLLKSFLDDHPHKGKLKRGMVLSVWEEIVGERIAEQTENLHFRDGKLIIHVQNPAWRQEIHMKRYSIAQKLNQQVGEKVVKEIVVKA
ncbi:MAG: DUF721 domain-containing protein [Balneolaceae bacterium]|nr:DUF721 domain-containing protein [Balneolaceae bacterium]